jgi:hypothetical protein
MSSDVTLDLRTPNLATALARVQARLPKLERDREVEVTQKSGGTYKYSYVTLANLTEAVLPLLAEHGLAFVAMPGAGSDGKMCVRYQLLHESGESLSGEFPISGEGGIQMIGGRITYARRYCLAALVGVAADEDDEARLADDGPRTSAQRAAPARRQAPPDTARPQAQRARPAAGPPPLPGEDTAQSAITDAQQRKMQALYRDCGVNDRAEKLRYAIAAIGRDIASSSELTRAEAGVVIDKLERWAAQSEPPAGGGQ